MRTPWIPGTIARVGLLVAAIGIVAACGSDPTATPTPRPTNTPTPTPTLAPGVPTPTPTATPRATPTPSFDAEGYFRGKQITLNIGFSPGGGYDTFSRLFAKYIPRYMPGNPGVVVRNVPGGGGLRGLQVNDREPADGYNVSILHPRFVKREVLGEDVEGFDPWNINYIGSASASHNTNALYAHREDITSWDQILAAGRKFTNGETAPGASSGAGAAFIAALDGPISIVYGYGGSAEILAAFDRKEVELTTNGGPDAVPRLYPEWIENKFLVPILWWSAPPEEDPEFLEWLEDLDAPLPPHVFDVLDLTEDQKRVFSLSESLDNVFSRSFVLHDDTPPEIVAVWREAFKQIVADPGFVQDAGIAGYEVAYTDPLVMEQSLDVGDLLDDPELRELFIAVAGSE